MPRATTPEIPRVVRADRIVGYAEQMRTDADLLRKLDPQNDRAAVLDVLADGLERVVMEARQDWVDTLDAASLTGKDADTIRWRCRHWWKPKGLARKDGGQWLIHVNALPAAAERMVA
jgi:hypothetical protein